MKQKGYLKQEAKLIEFYVPMALAELIPPAWSDLICNQQEFEDSWLQYLKKKKHIEHEIETTIEHSLYLHVPFCKTICSFCQFDSLLKKNESSEIEFILKLESQAKKLINIFSNEEFSAITIGGGTPSFLSIKNLEQALIILKKFNFSPNYYFSVELNPDSTTKEKVDLLIKYGVNRVSIGVQSFSPHTLKSIQRHYQNQDQVKKTMSWLKNSTIESSLDLVAGLPGENEEVFFEGFKQAVWLDSTQIVVFQYQPVSKHKKNEMLFNLESIIFKIMGYALQFGYHIYSQSKWSLVLSKNKNDQFNVRYMQHPRKPTSTLGLGPFAESYAFATAQFKALPSTANRPLQSYKKMSISLASEKLRYDFRNKPNEVIPINQLWESFLPSQRSLIRKKLLTKVQNLLYINRSFNYINSILYPLLLLSDKSYSFYKNKTLTVAHFSLFFADLQQHKLNNHPLYLTLIRKMKFLEKLVLLANPNLKIFSILMTIEKENAQIVFSCENNNFQDFCLTVKYEKNQEVAYIDKLNKKDLEKYSMEYLLKLHELKKVKFSQMKI